MKRDCFHGFIFPIASKGALKVSPRIFIFVFVVEPFLKGEIGAQMLGDFEPGSENPNFGASGLFL